MKISAKVRYGLRLLIDIARYEQAERPRTLSEIATSQALSEKFLSRLAIPLRRAGMIQSIRGGQGGFRLAKNPELITVLDVLEAIDGPLQVLDCLSTRMPCMRARRCSARRLWYDINDDFKTALRARTLAMVLADTHGGKEKN